MTANASRKDARWQKIDLFDEGVNVLERAAVLGCEPLNFLGPGDQDSQVSRLQEFGQLAQFRRREGRGLEPRFGEMIHRAVQSVRVTRRNELLVAEHVRFHLGVFAPYRAVSE